MSKSTALVAADANSIEMLEKVSSECNTQLAEASGRFRQAFVIAAGIEKFRQILTPSVMGHLLPLKDSALGFLTDENSRMQKGQSAYALETVRECLIEAALHGVCPFGNEFNILSGRCYLTKLGYARKVREYPGVTDLILTPGPVRMSGDRGAYVEFTASFKLKGKKSTLERKGPEAIPVRVNSGMGVDAIIGKAERKMLAYLYRVISGSDHTPPEGEVGDVELVENLKPVQGPVIDANAKPVSNTERVKAELKKRQPKAEEPAKPETAPAPMAAPASAPAPEQEPAKEPKKNGKKKEADPDLFAPANMDPENEKKPLPEVPEPVQEAAEEKVAEDHPPVPPEVKPEPKPEPKQKQKPGPTDQPVESSAENGERTSFRVSQVLVTKQKDPKTGDSKTMGYRIVSADDGRVFFTQDLKDATLANTSKMQGKQVFVEYMPAEKGNELVVLKLEQVN